MRIHPHDRLLRELVGMVDDSRYHRLVNHLLTCCRCRQRLKDLILPVQGPLAVRVAGVLGWRGQEFDYGSIIQAVERHTQPLAFHLEKQRVEAVGLIAALLARPHEQRELMVRNNRRYQTWGVLEQLVDLSRAAGRDDRQRGEALAKLALVLADAMRSDSHHAERLEDMRARAWTSIASTLRRWSDLGGSERAIQIAYSHLKNGTREPLERALYLDIKASLMRAQRRFPTAIRLLERAISIFQDLGDAHRAGRSLINLAIAHEYSGAPEKGIPLLYQAFHLIDEAAEPKLLLMACHNLISMLSISGRFMEAQGLLIRARPMYASHPDPANRARLKWVSGRIAMGLGQERDAERLLLAARDIFIDRSMAYEAALVCLELASFYVEQGRTAEMKRLAETMLPIFSSLHIHREALAALTLLGQAMVMEQATVALVGRVHRFVKGLEQNRELKLESLEPETAT